MASPDTSKPLLEDADLEAHCAEAAIARRRKVTTDVPDGESGTLSQCCRFDLEMAATVAGELLEIERSDVGFWRLTMRQRMEGFIRRSRKMRATYPRLPSCDYTRTLISQALLDMEIMGVDVVRINDPVPKHGIRESILDEFKAADGTTIEHVEMRGRWKDVHLLRVVSPKLHAEREAQDNKEWKVMIVSIGSILLLFIITGLLRPWICSFLAKGTCAGIN